MLHVAEILPKIRPADVLETHAASGQSVASLLPVSVMMSRAAWAGLIDGEVACIFGVAGASLLSTVGYPWLIGTPAIEMHAKAFLRRCRPMVRQMLELYPTLVNYVDVRNIKAVEWLRWLGFKIHEPEPFGISGLPFNRFTMGDAHV